MCCCLLQLETDVIRVLDTVGGAATLLFLTRPHRTARARARAARAARVRIGVKCNLMITLTPGLFFIVSEKNMQGYGKHKCIEYSFNEFILLRNTTRVRVRGRGRGRGRGRVISLTTGLFFIVSGKKKRLNCV